ncbi:hypothetical protein VTN31DRAFT_2556 [Thermomyces dupontii]|uniref:uncharacterized protein n=1 Tax=Talaromyces thermophilus TaxID=28565 RepID=UPI0037445814
MGPPESSDGDNGRRNSSRQSTPSLGLPHRPRNSPRTSTESGNVTAPIPDEEHGADLPLTLSASVVLTGLPRDAHQALADAEAFDSGKVTIRFQPLPSAPILRKAVFKISASQKFETVVNFLRKKLDCQETDSVFCYINNVFAPSLDESVGGLWRCFKNETDDQLWVQYSMTPFFG